MYIQMNRWGHIYIYIYIYTHMYMYTSIQRIVKPGLSTGVRSVLTSAVAVASCASLNIFPCFVLCITLVPRVE